MLALILAAAEEAAHHEPSKTPFYVAGIVLTVWALAISGMGIRDNGFAATRTSGAAVALVTAVLVAATMATSIITG